MHIVYGVYVLVRLWWVQFLRVCGIRDGCDVYFMCTYIVHMFVHVCGMFV